MSSAAAGDARAECRAAVAARRLARSSCLARAGIEEGDISDAPDALRNAENARQQVLEQGASDGEIRQVVDQLRATMDCFMQAMAEQLCPRWPFRGTHRLWQARS